MEPRPGELRHRLIEGLASIVGHYDAFIVDLWGVLHNGLRVHPGALECLRRLRAEGKLVGLLSNAPRRVAVVQERLEGFFGIEHSSYDFLMTSGEAAWESLICPPNPWHARLRPPAFALGPDGHQTLDHNWLTTSRESAKFVLAVGPWRTDDSMADYERLLVWFKTRRLPMLCANPDLEVVFGERLMICAGRLARRYQQLGGEVAYHGKPFQGIYERCLQQLGMQGKERRILALGDSLDTDIAGGRGAGLDTALITGGIHLSDLRAPWGELPPSTALENLLKSRKCRPNWVLPAFRW